MTHAPGRLARADAASPLRATLALVRWPNACIAAAGVLLGAWWAAPAAVRSPRVVWTVVVALALTAVMNVANDAEAAPGHDRTIQRVVLHRADDAARVRRRQDVAVGVVRR